MSYQVLARKWRPKSFATLVGQEHVVRALTHALDEQRLHHAYLFTGTRGVGKTTLARIMAKALNCETGVTSTPCGTCSSCLEIDGGRFVDYLELDAASNRGVEDMTGLLEKATYAPTRGRYKVYVIDEVHQLSGHAFNAMLKTLEEPPEHVKFILATTDPQKIPVTVLSRCLQFNLKQMPPGHIVDHLSRILEAEAVPFEAGALRHIAKGASGSMRDALSLLDQAIAHGAGKVLEEQVTHMLGTVGDDHLHAVLDALAAGQMDAMLAVADAMEARSLSFDAALQALASLLGRVALVQFAPTAVADEVERQRLLAHAAQFDAEFLQLAYQIVIHGRDELALAPDEYTGFAMTLLRLHAFRPEQPPALGSSGGAAPQGGTTMARKLPPSASASGRAVVSGEAPSRASVGLSSAAAGKAAVPAASDSARVASEVASPVAASASPMPGPSRDVAPWEDLPPEALLQDDSYTGQAGAPDEVVEEPSQLQRQPNPTEASRQSLGPRDGGALRALTPPATGASAEVAGSGPDTPALRQAFDRADWRGVIRALGLGGLVREFAQHCEWLGFADDQLDLRLSETHRHLLEMNRAAVDRVQDMLSAGLARPIRVRIATGAIAGETPAQRDEVERRARHAEAVAALECDPFVRELIERFDATLVEASVRPL